MTEEEYYSLFWKRTEISLTHVLHDVTPDEVLSGVSSSGEEIVKIVLDPETKSLLDFFGFKNKTTYVSTSESMENRIQLLSKPVSIHDPQDKSKLIQKLLEHHKILILCLMELGKWGYPSAEEVKKRKALINEKNAIARRYNAQIDHLVKILEYTDSEDTARRNIINKEPWTLDCSLIEVQFKYIKAIPPSEGKPNSTSLRFSHVDFNNPSPIYTLIKDYITLMNVGGKSLKEEWQKKKLPLEKYNQIKHQSFLVKFIDFLNSHTGLSSSTFSDNDQFWVYTRIMEVTGRYYTMAKNPKLSFDHNAIGRVRKWYNSVK